MNDFKFQKNEESVGPRRLPSIPARPASMSLRNYVTSQERDNALTMHAMQSTDNRYEVRVEDGLSVMVEESFESRIAGASHSVLELESADGDLYASIPEIPRNAAHSNSMEMLFNGNSNQSHPDDIDIESIEDVSQGKACNIDLTRRIETVPLGSIYNDSYAKVSSRSDLTNTISILDYNRTLSRDTLKHSISDKSAVISLGTRGASNFGTVSLGNLCGDSYACVSDLGLQKNTCTTDSLEDLISGNNDSLEEDTKCAIYAEPKSKCKVETSVEESYEEESFTSVPSLLDIDKSVKDTCNLANDTYQSVVGHASPRIKKENEDKGFQVCEKNMFVYSESSETSAISDPVERLLHTQKNMPSSQSGAKEGQQQLNEVLANTSPIDAVENAVYESTYQSLQEDIISPASINSSQNICPETVDRDSYSTIPSRVIIPHYAHVVEAIIHPPNVNSLSTSDQYGRVSEANKDQTRHECKPPDKHTTSSLIEDSYAMIE